MGLKKYILFSIIFIVAVGAYVYSFNGDTYTLTFFGVPLSLKVALWVVLPTVILAVASVLHMVFYSFKNYLTQRNLQKDYKTYLQYVKYHMLDDGKDMNFTTKWYDLPAKVLKHFKFDATKDAGDINDEELKEVIDTLKKIESGEFVSLKKYKLPKDNYFVKKNILNKLFKDKKESEQILKNCEDKNDDICQKAFEIYCSYASYADISKQGFEIKKELFDKLMQRFEDKDDEFEFSVDELKELLKKFDFNKSDYLVYAKKLKTLLNPEAVLSIFETLSNEKEEALQAYLYLLFEFQMIDKARELLLSLQSNECEKFKYILELKDCGKNFDIDIFFDL